MHVLTRRQNILSEPVEKKFFDGTQRLIAPAQTVMCVQPFMREMGITRIANVTGLDFIGIPVTMVCRPNSRSVAVSQGKGLTLDAARASGLMESLELYHAERITQPLKFASYEEMLRTHRAVEVDDLPFCRNSRYHPALPMLWIEGFDVLNDEDIWVPFELANMSAVRPEPPGSGCFISSSNGLASGNHLIEAVIHGVCEIVERDATTLWHVLGADAQQAKRIDLNTVDDIGCLEALAAFERARMEVIVWDLTSDTGIPAFQCLIFEREETPTRELFAAMGMGCHSTRHIALSRALTEAAQSRLTLISGSRDDVFRPEYEEDSSGLEFLCQERRALCAIPPTRSFNQAPSCDFPTFNEDLNWLLHNLKRIGIERVIVIDLTKAEFAIPVARVICPKMESLYKIPGYTPGLRALALAGE